MAERLGEALLDLRTNDAGFTQGVARAEGQAGRLGQTLDKTKGSSAQLAVEMTRTGQSAQQMSAGFEQAGQRVVQSAGQQRAGMQQLSFQLNDMATMFALGARPMQIFASQSGQVIQSVQMMMGGTSRLAAFLGGPWGIAITSAVVVLTPFIGKLFETSNALESVDLASSKLGDAQSILGSVMDSTTLKMKEQTGAAIALARAQAAVGLSNAMTRQADARAQQRSISQGGFGDLRVKGTMGGLRLERANNGQDLVDGFRSGSLTAAQVEAQARARMKAGVISPQAYEALLSVPNEVAEGENIKWFEDTLAALNGDKAAARRIFGPQGGGGGRSGGGRAGGGPRGRTEAQQAADFDGQSIGLQRQTLQAQLSLATNAEERANIQEQLLTLERDQRIAEVEASDLGPKRKAALIAQIEALLGVAAETNKQGEMTVSANRGLEGQIITRERLRQQAFDELALSDIRFRGEMEMLQNQMALADTQAAQKVIALRIYDAQVAEERIRLQKIIDLEALGAVTKKEADEAKARLAALNANAASGRSLVGQQNETDVERYMRNLNKTPGQINEAIDGIKIDGLEALNDGLTRAIMGAESLGEVFTRVADQIIADLLRIAIQQMIIKPLASKLFGGGDLFSAAAETVSNPKFAGLFATGGQIPTGQFGIVGEEGPELAFATPGGLGILSNPKTRALLGSGMGSGTTVPINIAIDATGADAAAIARVNAQIERLRSELPSQIVTTVREAKDRRLIS